MFKSSKIRSVDPGIIAILMACAGSITVGFSPIFVRISDLGPMTTGFYRMLCALPLLYGWMALEKKAARKKPEPKMSSKNYIAIGFAGFFSSITLALWNWSIDYTAVINSSLFNNTAAFFVPLFSYIAFREIPSRALLFGILLGLLGCSLLVSESFTLGWGQLYGDFAALISGATLAIHIIFIKRLRSRLQAGTLMFWVCFFTLPFIGAIALVSGESFWPLTRLDVLSIFGQSLIVHVLGRGLLAYAMGELPVSYGALIMLLTPATAALLGWGIFGETLSVIKIAGVSLVLISIMAVRKRDRRKDIRKSKASQ
ncbi:MAG: DMT family transporter [bacterium]|nr:DMT family transporter [bacterium]